VYKANLANLNKTKVETPAEVAWLLKKGWGWSWKFLQKPLDFFQVIL
jgi:hypothetical protein